MGVWPTRPTPIIVHSRSSGAPQTAGSNRAPSGADDCSHTDPHALGPGDTVRPGKSAAAGGSRTGRAGSAVQLWEEQGGPSDLLGAVLPLLRPGQSDQRRRRRQQKRRRRRSSTSAILTIESAVIQYVTSFAATSSCFPALSRASNSSLNNTRPRDGQHRHLPTRPHRPAACDHPCMCCRPPHTCRRRRAGFHRGTRRLLRPRLR